MIKDMENMEQPLSIWMLTDVNKCLAGREKDRGCAFFLMTQYSQHHDHDHISCTYCLTIKP